MTRPLLLAAFLVPAAFAQGQLDCARARYCEMREQTTSATGRFTVDDVRNGSITVRGSNRSDVLVRMRVESDAHSQNEARDLFGRIHTHVTPGRFSVDGPDQSSPLAWFFETSWSVSVEVLVPRNTELVLVSRNGSIRAESIDNRVRAESRNGSIRLQDIAGDVDFDSRNGAVTLDRIGGSVRGQSRNGGIEVELAGSSFNSRRLEVESRNGAVTVEVPRSFNAHVITDTRNGRLNSDFPMTVRGWIQRGQEDGDREFDIGSGGSPMRITTRNGGIRLRRI